MTHPSMTTFNDFSFSSPFFSQGEQNISNTRYGYPILSSVPVIPPHIFQTQQTTGYPLQSTHFSSQQVIREWRSPQNYFYPSIPNPIDTRVARVLDSKKWEGEYSSTHKAHYSVVPSNTQYSSHAYAFNYFDINSLRQTDVLDPAILSKGSLSMGVVSLGSTVLSLFPKMGTIKNTQTGENLGTCTLIAHNLVLVAFHAVAGFNIQNIQVTFGLVKKDRSFFYSNCTNFSNIIEADAALDYAIIQLSKPVGEQLGFVPLNVDNQPQITEPALLHYPLGKPLKVSVNKCVQTSYQIERLEAYHDSDYFSSGGAYFDPRGYMIAMHLGTERERDTINLHRYAQPLEAIVRKTPYSLLGKFARYELSQAEKYFPNQTWTFLQPAAHNYLIDEEGRESEKILRALLKDELEKDKKIKKNSNGTLLFDSKNLDYIEKNYKEQYEKFLQKCLGITGLHKKTRLYSVASVIESDHLIPHDVWKSTTNEKMKKVVEDGGGERAGENDMPAITIPYKAHRNLLTTGSGLENQKFRQSLVTLCNEGKVDEALIQCLQQYKDNGLLENRKTQIKNCIQQHVECGLISNAQVESIINNFF